MPYSLPQTDVLDAEAQEAMKKFRRFFIPFALGLLALIVALVYRDEKQRKDYFRAQHFDLVVADRYIGNIGRPVYTVVLRSTQQDFLLSGEQNYNFFRRGDSLCKPAGSREFYFRSDSSGYRVWKELSGASNY